MELCVDLIERVVPSSMWPFSDQSGDADADDDLAVAEVADVCEAGKGKRIG